METSPAVTPPPDASASQGTTQGGAAAPSAAAALLTETEASQRLGLSRSQLAGLRARRRISFSKRGGRVFYAPEEVERVRRAFEVPALHPVVRPLKATPGSHRESSHADTTR